MICCFSENITEIKQAEKIREKIKAVREKRRLEERLAGVKSLADESDEELDDAKKWVERQKRAAEEKSLAEKRVSASTFSCHAYITVRSWTCYNSGIYFTGESFI